MSSVNAPMNPIQSERQRILATASYVENQVISIPLPRDTCYKGLWVRISGAVGYTYTGTPVARAEGSLNQLVSRIDLVVDGQNTIFSSTPHAMHMHMLMAKGFQPERFSSAAAAAATDNYPLTEGNWTYGTSGQVTTLREAVYLPLECLWAEVGYGREGTYLNARSLQSLELKINCQNFANLLGFGNTAAVTITSNTLSFEIVSVERQDVPAGAVFDIYKRTVRTIPISGEFRDYAIDIPLGNYLTGVQLMVFDGASGTATTATGRLASNSVIQTVTLLQNGQQVVMKSGWKALVAKNRAVYGINAPYSGGVSRLDGVAHVNLLSRSDLSTAMPKMRPLCDSLQLLIDTGKATTGGGPVDYTTGAQVIVVTEELVKLT